MSSVAGTSWLESLRQRKSLKRMLLAWWLLFIGASALASVLMPVERQLVCNAAGAVKWVVTESSDAQQNIPECHDCPLCTPVAHALPVTPFQLFLLSGLGQTQVAAAPPPPWHIVAALPRARGPPVL